jgi:hypothetical protein
MLGVTLVFYAGSEHVNSVLLLLARRASVREDRPTADIPSRQESVGC